ncbi:AAA-ATPase ASD, mitochondrial [Heracleum sosnowskyi]|uniref:AAA-ATPase ASD, mitochondrial n=1 Tax=Heracleum sosnowskyi TaxID=360622 RepID=A0AAD8I0M4_9APIA|nr:AAA-ATPase ASD, mitochondrial [Heracleum sosnowskyi]
MTSSDDVTLTSLLTKTVDVMLTSLLTKTADVMLTSSDDVTLTSLMTSLLTQSLTCRTVSIVDQSDCATCQISSLIRKLSEREPMNKLMLEPWKMKKGRPWKSLGSMIATLMFVGRMVHRYNPYFRQLLVRYIQKLVSGFDPYIQITFDEHSSDALSDHSNSFIAIKHYLEENSSRTAKKLKADSIREGQALLLGMDDDEEITDEYQGVKVWWSCNSKVVQLSKSQHDKQRCYTLSFHRRYRDLITKSYMQHVLNEGIAISLKNRQRKLYTNKNQMTYAYRPTKWAPADFKHPATFDTLALKPEIKKDIMDDLLTFSKAKDYYMKVGKPWKRGYLLYGPPGTGKSTLIAAMANLLQYDVYDLELTSVAGNTELKKLLLETTEKSIIVIEDIDCSLDLTGKREKVKAGEKKETMKQKTSQVTLSGILNAIDGLWSSCAGERIIVLTTNYVEKLDPALIRRGRMDKHIELSYCSFEAFKVLAKNYLDIESHELFGRIEELLAETSTSPADVAENLIPKSAEDNGESCLIRLISVLEDAKEVAMSRKLKAQNTVKKKKKAEESSTLEAAKESSTLVAAKGDYSIRYYLKYVSNYIAYILVRPSAN